MQHTLSTPCARQDLAALRAGDTVLLSGTVYTARDAAHKRMMELLDAGGEPPFPLAGSAVYYVGPTPGRPGQVVGSAGPTTSGRMDAYSPRLIRLGQLVMIGKGARSEAVKRAVKECGAVYLARRLKAPAAGGDAQGAEKKLERYGREKGLTRREQEVLALVLRGEDGPRIARELYISPGTVKVHVHNILQKAGCRSRAELCRAVDETEP